MSTTTYRYGTGTVPIAWVPYRRYGTVSQTGGGDIQPGNKENKCTFIAA